MMALVFSGFSVILHLAHQFANFRRSLRKSFAANCTFLRGTVMVESVEEESLYLWVKVDQGATPLPPKRFSIFEGLTLKLIPHTAYHRFA